MQACPACSAQLEDWQISCHSCGNPVSVATAPGIKEVVIQPLDLNEACQKWLDKGIKATRHQDFDLAVVCLQEALYRLRSLPDSLTSEVNLRMHLAEALLGAKKFVEAIKQYETVVDRSLHAKQREEAIEQIARLQENQLHESYQQVVLKSSGAAQTFEIKFLPLYCGACKGLLAEDASYQFRRSLCQTTNCLCGYQGPPVVKKIESQIELNKKNELKQKRRTQLIQIADSNIKHGKKRSIAIVLALAFGDIGAHKFYLGEIASGFISTAFFWTFVPWLIALYDAFELMTMSKRTFNLHYNLPQLLSLVEPMPEVDVAKAKPFSMDITYDPEDYLDDLSQ